MAMTTEEILKAWEEESIVANKCIVEILDSYMDCTRLMKKTLDLMCKVDDKAKLEMMKMVANVALEQEENFWMPVLESTKKLLEGDVNEE